MRQFFKLCFFLFAAASLYTPAFAGKAPKIAESFPFPAVSLIKIDGIGFDFKPKFSDFDYPRLDKKATIAEYSQGKNLSDKTIDLISRICDAAPQNFFGGKPEFSYSINNEEGLYEPIIRYKLVLDEKGNLLEFEKTISVPEFLLKRKKFTVESMIQKEFRNFPNPNYLHDGKTDFTKFKTIWWGIDKKSLFKNGKYSAGNATCGRQYWCKVVRANIVEAKNGSFNIYIRMFDNFKQLKAILRANGVESLD